MNSKEQLLAWVHLQETEIKHYLRRLRLLEFTNGEVIIGVFDVADDLGHDLAVATVGPSFESTWAAMFKAGGRPITRGLCMRRALQEFLEAAKLPEAVAMVSDLEIVLFAVGFGQCMGFIVNPEWLS